MTKPVKRDLILSIEIGKINKKPRGASNLRYAIGLIPELALTLPPRAVPARHRVLPREGGLPALPKFLPQDRRRAPPRLGGSRVVRLRAPPRAGSLTLVEKFVLLLDAVVTVLYFSLEGGNGKSIRLFAYWQSQVRGKHQPFFNDAHLSIGHPGI